jgi:hypothetical protein
VELPDGWAAAWKKEDGRANARTIVAAGIALIMILYSFVYGSGCLNALPVRVDRLKAAVLCSFGVRATFPDRGRFAREDRGIHLRICDGMKYTKKVLE